eukprot:CCRYP_003074-RA/>CCRYP_003074-RA protein AED:0.03 eAED:0.03 QI:2763/1/1/1/1/0.66/3/74/286
MATISAASSGSSNRVIGIDYAKVLGEWAKENELNDINVKVLLQKNKGKEPKLFVRLAKKYNKPNALNDIFRSRASGIDSTDYHALTELYLSVFYPSDLGECNRLLKKYEGEEKELFSKLAQNFNACNPFDASSEAEVDYNKILTTFFSTVDPDRVSEVNATLEKCKGRETILLAVLSKEYQQPNPLNAIFATRVESIDANDYDVLIKLYLSVFNPKIVHRSSAFLGQYKGKEGELFAKLASKFHAINPLANTVGSRGQENFSKIPCSPALSNKSMVHINLSPCIAA